ncbi:MAG: FMN-binding glutamate synthase family protein [Methylomonas sp.]|nr:FMN-binding glutamate synthase family protein [Methylomonas sp.]
MRTPIILIIILSLLFTLFFGQYWPPILWSFCLQIPVLALGLYDMRQTRHSLLRNYPVIGHARKLAESLRPMVQQYFVESDTDGAPINRIFRSVVYQRAKNQMDTVPYGTKFDIYRVGYEWLAHSLAAKNAAEIDHDLRVTIGGSACLQPYRASVLNISAMSFGALSAQAIRALNGGAKLGGFAHNTGEGGLSEHHIQQGGDLIWQIGTAYFGCRDRLGRFDAQLFADKANMPQIKMLEIKLSQGAKPGHGGVLPACKNTPEIAAIRGVAPYTQIDSPARHSVFSTPIELMRFIAGLRELSGGKPVGFKLCIGQRGEFLALCKAMLETGIRPDFITVDGGEGGTGAAPVEYTNSVGMPLMDALVFVSDCLNGFDLRREIKIIASGKIFTGFHIVKRLALGADLCNSARGMMLALGCIQSLQCNKDTCPTGVATQNQALGRGLVVADKIRRVANYHRQTVASVADIIAAAGLNSTAELNRSHIFRRVDINRVNRYEDIYPSIPAGRFLTGDMPLQYAAEMKLADPHSFGV